MSPTPSPYQDQSRENVGLQLPALLSVLTPDQVCRVDDALARVGAFGEVRLIIQRGRLRFIQTLRSENFDGVER